jgi:hypothetical protein
MKSYRTIELILLAATLALLAAVASAQPNVPIIDPMLPATPYPHGDPCVDPVYYQRNIDLSWMIKGGTPGHTYQGGGNHAFTVIHGDFLHYGVIGQGCTACGYKKPPTAGPALDWWNKCFVSPRHISSYLCETAVVPVGTQNYQMKTLIQVTDPAKRASWAATYGCTLATPTPTPSVLTPTPIPGGDPAARYIESLVNHGVTTGCGVDAQGRPIFCPDRSMTRREVAVWIVKSMGWTLSNCVGAFADVPCQ